MHVTLFYVCKKIICDKQYEIVFFNRKTVEQNEIIIFNEI